MLQITIVCPERIVFSGEIEKLTVPGTLGEFEILDHHAPIISSLEPGTVSYQLPSGQQETLEIQGGFVEVQKNVVSLCVEI